MSRTYKDLSWKRKYPNWSYDHDYVSHGTYEHIIEYEYDFTDGNITRVKLDPPKVITRELRLPGKTTLPKLRRTAIDRDFQMYSGSPSWWTRLTMNRPKRRACRAWERKVLFQNIEEADCPDYGNKPFCYYY